MNQPGLEKPFDFKECAIKAYTEYDIHLCTYLESQSFADSVYIPRICTFRSLFIIIEIFLTTNQFSQIALAASSLSLSAFSASFLVVSLFFHSFSLTALSYALPSSVFFGGFIPSAPAINRPAAADDFSGRFSKTSVERGVLLGGLELYALAKDDQSVLFLRKCE